MKQELQKLSIKGIYNLNLDWTFTGPMAIEMGLSEALEAVKDENGSHFYSLDYNDSNWDRVSLPHTFNAEDSFKSVANNSGDMGVRKGISFYRKIFALKAADQGKKAFIEFERVRQAAYVYLNGFMVGYYEAGIAPFGFDLTPYIKYDGPNVLAIAIDNATSNGMPHGRFFQETLPGTDPGSHSGEGFQWNSMNFNPVFGGLTGNVRLHMKNNVYLTLPLYSNLKTKGIHVYATDINVKTGSAIINVESEVRNECVNTKELSVGVIMADAEGRIVSQFGSSVCSVTVAQDKDEKYLSIVPKDAYHENPMPTVTDSRDSTVIKCSYLADNLKLWCPGEPHLYQVFVILKEGDKILDCEKISTGFRKLEVIGGKNGGVFINEQFHWLTGYAQRATSEWAVIGLAPDWLLDYDAKLVKESNANFIRWMHVATHPGNIRAGDKYGIACIQPAGDQEKETHGRQWDQRVEAMRDVIIYFRNSPSILFWEAGNNAVSLEHMQEMVDLRHTLDPHGRPMGCRSLEEEDVLAIAEWVGTMYGRKVRGRQGYTEKGLMIRDRSALIETEYSRDESPRRVWDDYSPPNFDYINLFSGSNGVKEDFKDAWDLTAEDFVVSNTDAYYEFFSRRMQANSPAPYYSGAAAMVWSDSNQHGRQQCSENARMSGRVDPIRIKKQSFYAFKAMQSEKPEVYLAGHWNYPLDSKAYVYPIKDPRTQEYTGKVGLRDAVNKTIYVIGSPHISKVGLFINGELFAFSRRHRNSFLYQFEGVNILQPGIIEAVGYNGQDQELARHALETVGAPARIKLTPIVGPEGFRADGSDIAFIDVQIVDDQDRVYPLDYEKIHFAVSGPAEFLGGYNSGVEDLGHNRNYVYAECGTNRVFLRSTLQPGPVTLRAFRPGMPTAATTIEALRVELDENGLTQVMPQIMQPCFEDKPKAPAVPAYIEEILVEDFKEESLKIFVDGQEVNFAKDHSAYRKIGAYGPAKPFLEALNLEYTFMEDKQLLRIQHKGTVIEARVGDADLYTNGLPSTINDWPEIIDGVLYVEISAVAAALGLKSYWGGDNGKYFIVTQ